MLISIVTGTYNRLASLDRLVQSVRREIPRGLAYEIVIVDGGSSDGTLDWCRAQADIRLIEHGELRGAIRAFCDGAQASLGEYVVMANDDVIFRQYSILAALSHLERTPDCGAVAFADNRISLVRGDGTEYRVDGVGATTADGKDVMVVYAQVGMFRKWLGDRVGWWGADDPIMGQARTYGGDNYLSARIWEAGYTVDAVPQAQVQDFIADDDLRTGNAARGPHDSRCYYTRFPTVMLPAKLANAPASDRLRVLCLPIYEPNYPGRVNFEHGLTEALADYGLAIEIDYINEPFDLVALCWAWQPDLLITQIQGPSKLTAFTLASARNVCPQMTVVNWNGDAHEHSLISPVILDILQYVDLQTTINAAVLPTYANLGIRAAYWQIGYKDPVDDLPDVQQYEVLFQGNCYNHERNALVKALRTLRLSNARKLKVGVYGNCQGANGNTHYDFAAQRALYQAATIVVGDTFPNTRAFVSNRLFQALAAGAFMLQQHSEGLQEFTGLMPGEHYIEWTDLADLKNKVVEWITPERAADRARIAAAGCAFVRANFSYDAQVAKLFADLLPMIAEAERATA